MPLDVKAAVADALLDSFAGRMPEQDHVKDLVEVCGISRQTFYYHFKDIVDVKFTARMEQELDEVESGEKNWKSLLGEFYGGFDKNLKQVEKDMEAST